MKKQIITILGILLLVTTITAGIITTFYDEDYIEDYARNYTRDRALKELEFRNKQVEDLSRIKIEYEITENKTCRYEHQTENFICSVKFMIIQPKKYEGEITVPRSSTARDIDTLIKNHFRESMIYMLPYEEIEYKPSEVIT